MATNEILPFANTAPTGENLLTQAEYLADPQRPLGNQPGMARQALVNKALRQSSLMSASLAQFIADNGGLNVTDALTPSQVVAGLLAAAKPHVVVFTVAPFSASTVDKSRADFVCTTNGQNQVEIMAAINAALAASAGLFVGMVVLLPGEYTLGAKISVPHMRKFVIYAEGTFFTGSQTTDDFWNFDGSSHCRIHLGYHTSNTTGAIIHIDPSTQGWAENHLSFQGLVGTAHTGKGLRIRNNAFGASTSKFSGTAIAQLDYGVSVEAADTGANIDTNVYEINFIRDCNVSGYEHGVGATTVNACTWRVNIEASFSGAIAIKTNAQENYYEATVFGATGGSIITLDAGATGNTFHTIPNVLEAFGASFVTDNSGNNTNRYGGLGADISVGLSSKGHFVKWSLNRVHTLADAGANLGLPDGNSTLPALTFDSNTAIGLYKAGGSSVGVAGILDVTKTGQIAFPATQNPSSDANTLDDCERGTFTPALTFATPGDESYTAGIALGHYNKIGRQCTITFARQTQVTYTSASGNLNWTGAPFAALNVTNLTQVAGLRWAGINKVGGYTDVAAQIAVGATTGNFNASGMGLARVPVTSTDVPTLSQLDIFFTMTYLTDT